MLYVYKREETLKFFLINFLPNNKSIEKGLYILVNEYKMLLIIKFLLFHIVNR